MVNDIREQFGKSYLHAMTWTLDMICYAEYSWDELSELACCSNYIFLQRLSNGKEKQYVQSIGWAMESFCWLWTRVYLLQKLVPKTTQKMGQEKLPRLLRVCTTYTSWKIGPKTTKDKTYAVYIYLFKWRYSILLHRVFGKDNSKDTKRAGQNVFDTIKGPEYFQ